MNKNSKVDNQQSIDTNRAKDFIGKLVLIGLTYIDRKGLVTGQKELYGKITAISQYKITVKLQGIHKDEIFNLPPDPLVLKKAQAGEYKLHTTGEVVTDPDLLVTYEINASQKS